MGVMACDRNGCENIMCNRLSDKYGYICYECFDELVASGPETNIPHFMRSEKKSSSYDVDEAEARFNDVFPK